MKEVFLEGQRMTDRESAHVELVEKLAFPAYYGANLDALWDLLTEGREELSVTLTHSGTMLSSLRSYGCKLLETFFEAEEENTLLHFTVSSEE